MSARARVRASERDSACPRGSQSIVASWGARAEGVRVAWRMGAHGHAALGGLWPCGVSLCSPQPASPFRLRFVPHLKQHVMNTHLRACGAFFGLGARCLFRKRSSSPSGTPTMTSVKIEGYRGALEATGCAASDIRFAILVAGDAQPDQPLSTVWPASPVQLPAHLPPSPRICDAQAPSLDVARSGRAKHGLRPRQSGWVLGTVLSVCTVVLLRECGRWWAAPSCRRAALAHHRTTIGREAFGEPGRWVVLVAVVLELWLGIVWLSIVAWNNCALMLAGYPLHWLLYVLLLATTATVWLRTLKQVGWLSLFAATALLVCVASIAAQLRLLPRLAPRDFSVARWDGVGASTSIIAAAFAGHVALPTIYGDAGAPSTSTCEPSALYGGPLARSLPSPLSAARHTQFSVSPRLLRSTRASFGAR